MEDRPLRPCPIEVLYKYYLIHNKSFYCLCVLLIGASAAPMEAAFDNCKTNSSILPSQIPDNVIGSYYLMPFESSQWRISESNLRLFSTMPLVPVAT